MEDNKYYRLVQEIVCQACYDYAKALIGELTLTELSHR